MGVSENREPEYSTLNSRILIIRTHNIRYPPIFGNSHVVALIIRVMNFGLWVSGLGFEVLVCGGRFKGLVFRGLWGLEFKAQGLRPE